MANSVSLSKIAKAVTMATAKISNSNSGSNSGSSKNNTVVAASTPAAVYTASTSAMQNNNNSGNGNSGSNNSGSGNSGNRFDNCKSVGNGKGWGKIKAAWGAAKGAFGKIKKLPKQEDVPVSTTPTTSTPTTPTAPATLEASRVTKAPATSQTEAMASTRDFTKGVFSSAQRFTHGSDVAGKFGETLAKAKIESPTSNAFTAELGKDGLKKNAETKAAGDRKLLSTVSRGMESVKKMRSSDRMLAMKSKMVAESAAKANTATEVKNTTEAVKQTTSQVLSNTTNLLI